MNQNRNQAGNLLILLVSVIGFIILVAALVLNFNSLIGAQKQAQTAIDAAALQAAKEMGRVVVDGPHGRIALVDDPSGDSKWPVLGVNTVLATLRLDALIAEKLNNKTMLYMIQNDLTQTEAAVKLLRTKIANSAAGNGSAYDRFGKPVNIKQAAYDAYIANQVRLAGTNEAPKNFVVRVGRMKSVAGQKSIAISVPNPENLDSIAYTSSNSKVGSDARKYYLADVDYPVAGLSNKVRFGYVAGEPSLVENDSLVDAVGLDVPVLAQVTADQPVQEMAPKKLNQEKESGHLATVAAAQVGNRVLLPSSGVLELSFPGGIPPEGGSGSPSFKNAKVIMNASQLDPAQSHPSSSYSGWNQDTPGQWFKTEGGPVWGNGSVVPAKFKGLDSRTHDDPSVALSFFVYDWLRSLSYRPNAQAVIDALSRDFTQVVASAGSQQIFAGKPTDLLQPAYAQAAANGITTGMLTIFPGADVDTLDSSQTLAGSAQYEVIEVNGVRMPRTDPRNLSLFGTDTSVYQRQHARMWGYIPAEGALQPSVALVKIFPYSQWPETVDGNPIWHLTQYIKRLRWTNTAAVIIYQAVSRIQQDALDNDTELQNLMGGLSADQKEALANNEKAQTYNDLGYKGLADQSAGASAGTPDPSPSLLSRIAARKQEVVGQLYKSKPRLLAALINSTYAMEVTSDMLKHMKTLTGIGVKLGPVELVHMMEGRYEVGGATFWAPRSPWPIAYPEGIITYDALYGKLVNIELLLKHVKTQILKDDGKLPTYQDSAAPGAKDWCALPTKEGGKVVPAVVFYKRTGDPVIGSRQREGSSFLPPALAQNAAPSAKFIFHYQLASETVGAQPGNQKVVLVADKTSKYSSIPTSKGQAIYQTVAGLKTTIPSGGKDCNKLTLKYQIQGRDLNANSYPESDGENASSPTAAADYFSDGLVAAWAITCPVVDNACPAPVAPQVDLLSRIFMDCTQHGGNWADFTFRGYPWLFTTIVEGDGSISTPWGEWTVRRYGGIFQYPDFPVGYIS